MRARQGAPTWRCDSTEFVKVKSSAHPTGGSVSRTARVPTARWDLKEVTPLSKIGTFLCLQVSTKPVFESHVPQSHINAPGALQHIICRGFQCSTSFTEILTMADKHQLFLVLWH